MTTAAQGHGRRHGDGTATRRRPVDAGSRWSELAWALSDAAVMTRRNLIHTVQVRALWPFIIVQPVTFVLLFALVFGGAIELPGGGSYREYLMAGVFAQAVAFTTYPTAVGVAFDMQLGLIDRFRTMPIHPSAMFIGRTLGDLGRMAISITVMALCGLSVGWRINDGFARAAGGFALLALFGYAMSWIGAYLGLTARSTQAAQSLPMLWLFPLTFVSNAFVPTQHMPGVLENVANWNPVSSVAAATRTLFGNPHPFADPDSFPAQHSVLLTVLWSVALTVIAAVLCTRRMRAVAR
jgi:ABC transporter DrrB family efflux protein